jgi:hypothetical protein
MPWLVSTCTSHFYAGESALIPVYIFSWEIVFTLGFELDIIRGKRPYRWTIWVSRLPLLIDPLERMTRQLYLGTRYFGLATFIVFFIDTDGGKVPCHVSSKFSGPRGPLISLIQPLVIANHVREKHPIKFPLDSPLMRRFGDAGFTIYRLGIRLFDNRSPSASLFPLLYGGSER